MSGSSALDASNFLPHGVSFLFLGKKEATKNATLLK